jgi:hypothetical protein
MSRSYLYGGQKPGTSVSRPRSSEAGDISTISGTALSVSRPLLPNIPASLSPLLASGCIEEYIDGQFRRFVERPGWPVAGIDIPAQVRSDVGPYLRALQDYLRPGDQTIIAMRVEALLSHWTVPERSPEVQDVVSGDWVRVIGNYPQWVVIEAANHWLDSETYRPTIAAIKRLCDEAVYEARLRLRVLSKVEGVRCLPTNS